MPGMNSGLNANDPVVVAAFRGALLHQGAIALLIFGLLGAVWAAAGGWSPPLSGRGAGRTTGWAAGWATGRAAAWTAEPAGRRLLRLGFGMLWILDGLLQAQPAMAVGLPSQVIEPTAAHSPPWVQHVVNWAGTSWSYHPIQAGAAAVWIQLGIGIWLLAAAGGPWSRLAGLASAGWALVVWVFGESFGGIFAPGLTWLFGAPGAAAFYCAAGALVATPDRYWYHPRLGRFVLAVMGEFLAGMALLQAWPGRGFWQGVQHGTPGTLVTMTTAMARTPQPGFLSALVRAFTGFDKAHGFAVNLFVVIVLAVIGATLLAAKPLEAARPGLLRAAVVLLAVLCLADWVFVEDFGFFGGLGTDPNSMIPMLLVVLGGYLALTRAPLTLARLALAGPAVAGPAVAGPAATASTATASTATASTGAAPAAAAPAAVSEPAAGPAPTPASTVPAAAAAARGWRDRLRPAMLRPAMLRPVMLRPAMLRPAMLRPATLRRAIGTASARSMVSAGAVGVILLGAAPMAAAQASHGADPILAESIAGTSAPLNYPAPPFRLTDQHGKPVSLTSLRGKVVLLTFLDPVCTTDCPLIAQEFRDAAQLLGAGSRGVELVAVALSPTYRSVPVIDAFDRQERLNTVPNWLFLTGTLAQLRQVWHAYGVIAYDLPAGAMTAHNDTAYVIDRAGHVRQEFSTDPGPGSSATKASFASLLAGAAQRLLGAA